MATDAVSFRPIRPRPEFAGILKTDETFARSGDSDSAGEQINGWFDRLMLQSGLETSPRALLMLCLLCAVALGGAVFVLRENILLAALAALPGAWIPVGTAVLARARRQSQILRQMPDMVGELARAARTGRSLEQCVDIVAADTPAPLGDELKRCRQKLQLGLSVAEAFAELPERTGVVSVNIFTMALSVHEQTGGDLVTVLDRLARTIRDRISFLGRLKAQTIASRATAVLMLLLPPFILAFFVFRDPDYFSDLMDSQWGLTTVLTAVTLQIIGSVWVLRILRQSKRT